MADGVYRLEVLGGAVSEATGLALDGNGDGLAGDAFVMEGNSSNGLFRLEADWDGDGGVSIFDFGTFAYWFAQPVPTAPAYVDLDGDGGVSIFDFPIFSANFGDHVVFAQAAAAVFAPTPTPTPLKQAETRQPAESDAPAENLADFRPPRFGQLVSLSAAPRRELVHVDLRAPDLEPILRVISADVLRVWSGSRSSRFQ